MDTSEALDLSKENIQPLKQGREVVKLGTALQAQTDVETHQKIVVEREKFELLIRMYEGDDPLQPHYDYVRWTEQTFPKHGPNSNIAQILENALSAFKDDARYKQDPRYAELLIKFIDTQPNPLEVYQIVYDQGLCTMCALFYKAWADELDKINDFKTADQVYNLGIRVRAEPVDFLKEAQTLFQASVGRRMLGLGASNDEEADPDYNRQALHKLQKRNIHSHRAPTGAPGQVKQHTSALTNKNNTSNATFKIYQGDDTDMPGHGDGYGKSLPKHSVVSKENTLKAGPWTQQGGKHRSKHQPTTPSTPSFKVHEDEGADINSGHHKMSSVPRALKTLKKDDFTCPLAVFEPPDPTKRPMYCKSKVYAGGKELQLEELRAAFYNRRYEQMAALKVQKELEKEMEMMTTPSKETSVSKAESEAPPEPPTSATPSVTPLVQPNMEQDKTFVKEDHVTPIKDPAPVFQPQLQSPLDPNQANSLLPKFHVQPSQGFSGPVEANLSPLHCQSFTVNTKEAMNVVQEMWNSPSPAQSFGKRVSSVYTASPKGLDESGVFKVPAVPPTKTPVKSAPPATPAFTIYSDDDSVLPTPVPTPTPVQPFQIYEDDSDTQAKPVDPPSAELPTASLPFNPPQPPTSKYAEASPSTMKMLNFQSDDSDSGGEEELVYRRKEPVAPLKVAQVPAIAVTQPTPAKEAYVPQTYEPTPVPFNGYHYEDKYDDLTCNTKAFDFDLPSSTPLVGHLKSASSTANQPNKQCVNGSYIAEDTKKCGVTKQELSILFEASKERYSSSSGSSGQTQGSVCTVGNASLPPVQPELVEKLAQISADQSDLEKSFACLSVAGPVDPFSVELITQLLSHIGYPSKHHLIGLHRFNTDAPTLVTNSTAKLGDVKYSVVGELGKGNYARVLKATRNGQPVALKQQRPAWEWEWYIVQELQSRLSPNMMSGFLHMGNGYIYRNGSILESEWAKYGSVLSVVNKLKIAYKGPNIVLALIFATQLMSIVEHLHKCQIIHGDIKPDNFVVFSLPTAELSEPCLKLIDFGRSIDMTLLAEGTTFTTVVTTDGFQCNEMKEGRPWTYQTDLYGLAGSIYCVLFYDYMKVVKKDNKWQLSNKIPRYMKPDVWQKVFSALLNVESCDKLPNLTSLRETLERELHSEHESSVNQHIKKLTNVLLNK